MIGAAVLKGSFRGPIQPVVIAQQHGLEHGTVRAVVPIEAIEGFQEPAAECVQRGEPATTGAAGQDL
jgi:hypothetical protein